ncbi:MAG: flagellar hook-basal body complex protein FliE [Polyangiales bacterium]
MTLPITGFEPPTVRLPARPGPTPPVKPKLRAPESEAVTTDARPAPSFAERLEQMVGSVNQAQLQAEHAAGELAAGRSDDIHGTMLQMRRADIRFRLLATARNRAIEAYHEIMRMGA